MKKFYLSLFVLLLLCFAKSNAQSEPDNFSQPDLKKMKSKLGLKAGYNFAKVIGATTSYSPRDNNGFMVGAFYSPSSSGRGYRTEIIFSRQGFSYDQAGKMQNVRQDYIFLPQLYTFTIGHTIQLQAGGQIGYLLNAQKIVGGNGNKDTSSSVTGYLNRFDYGAAAGIEIYPFKGLLIGARYNVSLGNVYKNVQTASANPDQQTNLPSPFPFPINPQEVKGKNSVIQLFVGYRF